ncbi:Crustacean hyperglycemic hormones 5 [Penaeus vannamei]|uniref:Crustacean hyperglycemic hormones 5 n=2 Tax=Penaeus vannamei TaxID=6689 RepID=A0A423SXC0_PENVA|nr:Crustacean hyperglycemic hormones 5 [Penaeus vannamei]
MWSAAIVTLLVAAAACASSWERSLEMEGQTSEFLPSFPQSPSLLSSAADHSLRKRSIFDHSCTGVFDRELIGRLNRVCDDCYNVFRDTDVATGCRSNCFYNRMFLQCLVYLFPPRFRNQYKAAVQMVGKARRWFVEPDAGSRIFFDDFRRQMDQPHRLYIKGTAAFWSQSNCLRGRSHSRQLLIL